MPEPLPKPRRRFGQNFLIDPSVVQWIVDATKGSAGHPVIEIGPGRGILTRALAGTDANLVAIEIDRDLVRHLREQLASTPNAWILEGDALRIDWDSRPADWFGPWAHPVIAGNLPYNVATPIVRRLFRSIHRFEKLVLMFQSEVADRLEAERGADYGYLSVERALFASVTARRDVPAGAFRPVPKISSSILVLEPLENPPEPELRRRAIALASIGFEKRRKQLLGILLSNRAAHEDRIHETDIRAIFEKLGLRPDVRAEQVSSGQFLELAKEIVFPGESPAR